MISHSTRLVPQPASPLSAARDPAASQSKPNSPPVAGLSRDVEGLRGALGPIAAEPADARRGRVPSSQVSSRLRPTELMQHAQRVLDALAENPWPLGLVAALPVRKLRMMLHPDRLGGEPLGSDVRDLALRAIKVLNAAHDASAPTASSLQKAAYSELHADARDTRARARADEQARACAEAARKEDAARTRAKADQDAERLRGTLQAVQVRLAEVEALLRGARRPATGAERERAALQARAMVSADALRAHESELALKEPRLAANLSTGEEVSAAAAVLAALTSRLSEITDARATGQAAEAAAKGEVARAEATQARIGLLLGEVLDLVGGAQGLPAGKLERSKLEAASRGATVLQVRAAEQVARFTDHATAWGTTVASLRALEDELSPSQRRAEVMVDQARRRRSGNFDVQRANYSEVEWAARVEFATAAAEERVGAVEQAVAGWRGDEARWAERTRGVRTMSPEAKAYYAQQLPSHDAACSNLGDRISDLLLEFSHDVQVELPMELLRRVERLQATPLRHARRDHLFRSADAWQSRSPRSW